MTEAERIENFIEVHRKICWESEYENGEFCIGENKVRRFFNEGRAENSRLQQLITACKDEVFRLQDLVKETQEELKSAQELNRELVKCADYLIKYNKKVDLHPVEIEFIESLIIKANEKQKA